MTEAIPAAGIGLPIEDKLPPATMAVSIDFTRFSFVDLAVLGRTPTTKSEQNIRDYFLLIEGLSYMGNGSDSR